MPRLEHCAGLAGFLLIGLAGCRPPPLPAGFVSTQPGRPRQVDGAVAGGLAAINGDPNDLLGGAGLQAEPYATERLSIPASVAAGSAGGETGLIASRLGVRHRIGRHFAYGAGLGPTMMVGLDDQGGLEGSIGGAFDLEAAVGHRHRSFAISGSMRPSFVVLQSDAWSFYATMEVTPAWYVLPRLALTGHVIGGPAVDVGPSFAGVYGFIGGGLGLFTHL